MELKDRCKYLAHYNKGDSYLSLKDMIIERNKLTNKLSGGGRNQSILDMLEEYTLITLAINDAVKDTVNLREATLDFSPYTEWDIQNFKKHKKR